MDIKEAIDLLKSLQTEADKKSEIRIYENFTGILSDLKNKNLTETQLRSIEEELDTLALKANPENRKKYFNQKLAELKTYLKSNFSLITEGYYTTLGVSLGIAFGSMVGVMVGTVFKVSLGVSYGIPLGMIIGLLAGRYMDAEAQKQNRVLSINLSGSQ